MLSKSQINNHYPLHYLVWFNSYNELHDVLLKNKKYLANNPESAPLVDIEKVDIRGRTPLHLAVTLRHEDCVRVLLNFGASVVAENRESWTALQEAVTTGDRNLIHLLLRYHNFSLNNYKITRISELVNKLKQSRDFYMELKWEFSSWVPLLKNIISQVFPSHSCQVWKLGANIRLDTTFTYDMGSMDTTRNQRENLTIMHKFDDNQTQLYVVDHNKQTVEVEMLKDRFIFSPGTDEYVQPLFSNSDSPQSSVDAQYNALNARSESNSVSGDWITPKILRKKLENPVIAVYMDLDNVAFERAKSGFFGWRSDKVETINGYQCKIFNASNFRVITRSRMDHMSDRDIATWKKKAQAKKLHSFEEGAACEISEEVLSTIENNNSDSIVAGVTCGSRVIIDTKSLSIEQYFDPNYLPDSVVKNATDDECEKIDCHQTSSLKSCIQDLGQRHRETVTIQTFHASVAHSDEVPLQLQEQVLPIIDLMSAGNSHFRKLRDFISLQLPQGFPVRIELPIYNILKAVVTFDNIQGASRDVPGVTCIREKKLECGGEGENDTEVKENVTDDDGHDSQVITTEPKPFTYGGYLGNIRRRLAFTTSNYDEGRKEDTSDNCVAESEESSSSDDKNLRDMEEGKKEDIFCYIDEAVFDIPSHYRWIGKNINKSSSSSNAERQGQYPRDNNREDEFWQDEMIQRAIEESLLSNTSDGSANVDEVVVPSLIVEAQQQEAFARKQGFGLLDKDLNDEEIALQCALRLSLLDQSKENETDNKIANNDIKSTNDDTVKNSSDVAKLSSASILKSSQPENHSDIEKYDGNENISLPRVHKEGAIKNNNTPLMNDSKNDQINLINLPNKSNKQGNCEDNMLSEEKEQLQRAIELSLQEKDNESLKNI